MHTDIRAGLSLPNVDRPSRAPCLSLFSLILPFLPAIAQQRAPQMGAHPRGRTPPTHATPGPTRKEHNHVPSRGRIRNPRFLAGRPQRDKTSTAGKTGRVTAAGTPRAALPGWRNARERRRLGASRIEGAAAAPFRAAESPLKRSAKQSALSSAAPSSGRCLSGRGGLLAQARVVARLLGWLGCWMEE